MKLTLKKQYMTTLLVLICLWFAALPLQAQDANLLSVYGKVYDSETLDPLPGTNVRLLTTAGKMVKGGSTLTDGSYMLEQVPTGTYQLQVTFVGYQPRTITLKLPQKAKKFKADDVMLKEDPNLLGEVTVTGKAAEMTVKGDTLAYNAAAYTVPDGSMVEELVKKLPGLEVDDNGKYTLNGKEITQIMVDGKSLFGKNMETILKNLSADAVEQIMAYDKQSDLARITGIDDGKENTVLDLKIKKERKKGWMNNANLSKGTHSRYIAKGMANRFVGDNKLSVVADVNNTGSGGLTDTQTAGLSFNSQKPKIETGGGFNTKFTQTHRNTETTTQNFENPRVAFTHRRNGSSNHNNAVDANFRMEWKPDSLTNIQFKPSLNYRNNNSNSWSHSGAFSSNPFLKEGITDPLEQMAMLKDEMGVNQNQNTYSSSGSSFSGNASLQVNRRLGKPGRNLNVALSAAFGKNENESDQYAQIDYYQLTAANGRDSIYQKIQYNHAPQRNHQWSARMSYTEPIAFKTYLQLSYNINYRYQNSNRKVASIFSDAVAALGANINNYQDWESHATTDADQSKLVENRYWGQDIRVQLRMNRVHYMLTAGLNVRPQNSETSYNKGNKHFDLQQNVVNMAPTIDFKYLFSKHERLNVRYNGSTGQPNILDLVPDTLDNASPLNIRLGNAELKPSFTHNMSASYNKYIPTLQRSYTLNLNYQTTRNGVSNRTEYNEETGGRVSRPENINGNWRASGNFNFNTALKDRRFRVNTSSAVQYTHAMSYVYKSALHQTLENAVGNTNVTQNVKGTYHTDLLECSVNGTFRYHHTGSSVNTMTNPDTYSFSYGFNMVYNAPWKMSFSTDLNEHCRRGYANASMNTNELVWNIRLSQRFLKKKNASVGFVWYDVLQQRNNVSQRITTTQSIDTRTENITSYCMLTLSYRFNSMGGGRRRR